MNTGRGCVYHHWVHLKARAEVICQERRQCHHHPLGPWEGKKGISVCPSWEMQQPGKHCIGKCFSDARQTSYPHLPRCSFFSLVFRNSNEKLSNSIALQCKLMHQRLSLLIFPRFWEAQEVTYALFFSLDFHKFKRKAALASKRRAVTPKTLAVRWQHRYAQYPQLPGAAPGKPLHCFQHPQGTSWLKNF